MKAINFVFSILRKTLRPTLLSLIYDTHEMNIQRQTSVISNFLYIEVFTQVPWTSIYPSFTVLTFIGTPKGSRLPGPPTGLHLSKKQSYQTLCFELLECPYKQL